MGPVCVLIFNPSGKKHMHKGNRVIIDIEMKTIFNLMDFSIDGREIFVHFKHLFDD
jgi:hypothetical protein